MKIQDVERRIGQRVMANLTSRSSKFFSSEVEVVRVEMLASAPPPYAKYPELEHPIRVIGPRPSGLVLVKQELQPSGHRMVYISPRQISDESVAEYRARMAQLEWEAEQQREQTRRREQQVADLTERLQQLGVRHAGSNGHAITLRGEALAELQHLLNRVEVELEIRS